MRGILSLRMRRSIPAVLLLGTIAIAGCASPAGMMRGGERWIADRLYFGRAMPGGDSVSGEAWNGFLRDVVTPRFPEGLTTWSAEGQWRDSAGSIIREASFVLELMHPPSSQSEERIEAIIGDYKERFAQESVLWVREDIVVRF